MINTHKIVVMDYESDSIDPYTCNPTQLAAVVIDPRTLTIISNSEFNSLIQPPDINTTNYLSQHKETIQFHAKCQNTTISNILEQWQNAPTQKIVWDKFIDYLDKYHITQSRKNVFTAPIVGGHNIINFDCIITDRLSKIYGNIGKDGKTTLFYSRDRIDLMNYCYLFFENLEEPKSYSLDTLREFFGIDKTNVHSADKDVLDTAKILIRFQKLIRKTASKIKFKDSFLNGEANGV